MPVQNNAPAPPPVKLDRITVGPNSHVDGQVVRADNSPRPNAKVLFINAVNEYAREQAQSFLRDSDQQKILAAYEAFDNQDGFASVATLDQIADKSYSLAIPLYVAGAGTASIVLLQCPHCAVDYVLTSGLHPLTHCFERFS